MKKAICFVLLVAVMASAAMIHGAAADKKGVYLCFIVDGAAVDGCADGTSYFDTVLRAVRGSGKKAAFFFDDVKAVYNDDCAVALMKAFSSGMPIGVFDTTRPNGGEELDAAMMYQKYVTRTVSRMILTNSATSREFSRGYSVFTADIILTSPELIEPRSLSNFEGTLMVVRISGETAGVSASLFNGLEQSGIYIITPTETGPYAYGREE